MFEVWPNDKFVVAKIDNGGNGTSQSFRLSKWIPRKTFLEAYLQVIGEETGPTERWYLDIRFYKPKRPECLHFPEIVSLGNGGRVIKSSDDDCRRSTPYRAFPHYPLTIGGRFNLSVNGRKVRHTVMDIFDEGVEVLVDSKQDLLRNSWPIQTPTEWIYWAGDRVKHRVVEMPGIVGVAAGGLMTELGRIPNLRAGIISTI